MILVDSLYINNSGGKMLLDYLVQELENTGNNIYYLFDARCKDDFKEIPTQRKIYLEASLFKRHQFYKVNKNKFTKVFCFGNLPPTIKLNIPVYTYFHQRIYLEIPEGLGFKQKLIFTIKTKIFKVLSKNTDLFIVQSQSMKEELLEKNSILENKSVQVIPFYEQLSFTEEIECIKNRMIYVSGGSVHKNHSRLLEAFKNVYDHLHIGELVLTIDDSFVELLNEIDELVSKGYPIYNLGFVDKERLSIEYAKAEYCIYPSLLESFGLGIIEAIESGCKVIGSDLPYLYAVCKPSLIFNPLDIESIEFAIESALTNELPFTEQKIHNNITNLVNLIID